MNVFKATCRKASLILCAALLCGTPAFASTPDLNTDALLEQYERQRNRIADMMEAATVFIYAEGSEEGAFGSGFIVGDGLIMTNGHVVDELGRNTKILVLNSRMPVTRATLLSMEHDAGEIGRDFALLRFTPPQGVSLPALRFCTQLRKTDRVSAWGFPGAIMQYDRSGARIDSGELTLPPLVYTEGNVSAFVEQDIRSIVHTASISSGNSGGPLINRKGEVVGINTWGQSPDTGVSVHASLTAADMVAFMLRNGYTPLMADGSPLPDVARAPDRGGASRQEASREGGSPDNSPGGKIPIPDRDRPGSPSPSFTGAVQAEVSGGKRPAQNPKIPQAEKTPQPQQPSQQQAGQEARQQPGQPSASGAGQPGSPEAVPNPADLLAAQQGDVQAMLRVGLQFSGRLEDPAPNLRQGLYWLEKAHEAGNARATEAYAVMLTLKSDSPASRARGLELMRKAADAPGADPGFQNYLSWLLYEGLVFGITPDYEESFRLAKRAADKGDVGGKVMLAMHYFDGVAVDADMGKARALLAEAEAGGSQHLGGAGLRAMLLYQDAESDDEVKALMPLALATAEKGGVYAQGLVAYIYAFDESFQNPVQAERWARQAAGQGNYLGQYVLGWLYMKGLVVERNDAMAWAYLDLAMQYAEDMEIDPEGPLLDLLEKRISPRDRELGKAIQNGWLFNWGLRDTP